MKHFIKNGMKPINLTLDYMDVFINLQNSGAKYVGNTIPRQIQNFSVCLGKASVKNLPKFSRTLCISRQQWLRHKSTIYQGHWWFGFLTVDITYSTNIILFTYNTLKREKQKSIFLPLITLFWFLFLSLLKE